MNDKSINVRSVTEMHRYTTFVAEPSGEVRVQLQHLPFVYPRTNVGMQGCARWGRTTIR